MKGGERQTSASAIEAIERAARLPRAFMQKRASAKPQAVPSVLLKRSSTSVMPLPSRYCSASMTSEARKPSGITSQRLFRSPKGRAKRKPNGTKMSMFMSSLMNPCALKLCSSTLYP